MSIPKELTYLYEIEQEHLFKDWSKWTNLLRKAFIKQITSYDTSLFQEQRSFLPVENFATPILKIPSSIAERTNNNYMLGKTALQENKVGLILLSGGQGTRLGFPGPKGCMPLPKLQQRTLFSILLSKCFELQKGFDVELPIAIMTSCANYHSIVKYLKSNNFFSINPKQITVFQQQSWPFLDEKMNWYMQSPGLIATGPGGNGAAFSDGKSILQGWKEQGIRWIQVIPIDNPLATPFDPNLIGCHICHESDLVILSIKRDRQDKEVGLIGESNGRLHIQEYMNPSLSSSLVHAYLGIFSCNIELALQWRNSFPWHPVRKKGMRYCPSGKQECIDIWKLEKFLFDIFPLSNKSTLLLDKKENCFSPIKSVEGRYSIEVAQNYFLQWEHTIRTNGETLRKR